MAAEDQKISQLPEKTTLDAADDFVIVDSLTDETKRIPQTDAKSEFLGELENLTDAEIQQVENIDTTTISTTQWGYVGEFDQSVITTASVNFNDMYAEIGVRGRRIVAGGTSPVGVLNSYKYQTNLTAARFTTEVPTSVEPICTIWTNDLGPNLTITSANASRTAPAVQIIDPVSSAPSMWVQNSVTFDDIKLANGIVTTDATGLLGSTTDLTDGTTATTQSAADNSTKLATTAYVDSAVGIENVWDRVTGTPNYVIPNTGADDVGATGARITKGWFTDVESTNMLTVGGASINANGVLDLISGEVTQLANIDSVTISNAQWGYVGGMDQAVDTTATPAFAKVVTTEIEYTGNILIDASNAGAHSNINLVNTAGDVTWDVSLSINGTEIVGSDSVVNKAAVEDSTNWDAAYTHVSSDGTSHTYIDQDLRTTATPTFDGATLTSTTAALTVPRMTTAQKGGLSAANGMIVYDTDLNKFQGYENGAWTSFI